MTSARNCKSGHNIENDIIMKEFLTFRSAHVRPLLNAHGPFRTAWKHSSIGTQQNTPHMQRQAERSADVPKTFGIRRPACCPAQLRGSSLLSLCRRKNEENTDAIATMSERNQRMRENHELRTHQQFKGASCKISVSAHVPHEILKRTNQFQCLQMHPESQLRGKLTCQLRILFDESAPHIALCSFSKNINVST